jgi:hypothetical protein
MVTNESLSSRLSDLGGTILNADLAIIEMYLRELMRLQSKSRVHADRDASSNDSIITLRKFKTRIENSELLELPYKVLILDYVDLKENRLQRIPNISNAINYLYENCRYD